MTKLDDKEKNQSVASFLFNPRPVVFYLWGVVGYLLLLIIVYAAQNPVNGIPPVYDFLAYAFPLLAGITAGIGALVKGSEKLLFGMSCALLTAGLLAYLRAHSFGGVALIVGLVLLLICSVVVLGWSAFTSVWEKRSALGLMTLIGAVILAFAVGVTCIALIHSLL